jgi:hypothetical protein
MEQEIAIGKRIQERNKLIYNFKYYLHRREIPDLFFEEKKECY